MRFAAEVVVDEVLPTVRAMLAERLREQGHTQRETAELLGISQSAVSKYAHGEVERDERVQRDPDIQALVDRVAAGYDAGELRPAEALIEVETTLGRLARGGLVAELHAEAVPELGPSEAAAIHEPGTGLQARTRVRASVRRGVGVLERTSGFARHVPAVGSNLVEALPDAETVADVAAVPGRILDVGGRATVPGEPEFGVSQHVAGLVLAARGAGSEARAALNVAYDDRLRDALVAAGHVAVEFDAEPPIESAVPAALGDDTDATVLYQTGAFGIEPVLYVLGPDAPTVARQLREADPDLGG